MCPKDHLSQQLQRSQLPTIWTIPDPMWDQLKELLPKEKEPGTPGRPPVPFRSVMDGILFVLRTGCHWNAVPSTFGSGSTCHRRFQQWIDAGMLEALVERMLRLYDELCSIDWRWQAADAKTLPAPLGGGQTGPNPTDLGKSGTKRHLLIDGRGVPLSVHLSAANCHDLKSLADLIGEGKLLAKERKKPTGDEPQHLCLDKAYDAKEADALLDELGYTGHIKHRAYQAAGRVRGRLRVRRRRAGLPGPALEGGALDCLDEQHAQAPHPLGEESRELPRTLALGYRSYHLPTNNSGIGSKSG
jgi:transposase